MDTRTLSTAAVAALFALPLAIAPARAHAQSTEAGSHEAAAATTGEHAEHAEGAEHEEHESRFHFGFAGSAWTGFTDNGPVVATGPGMLFEITLVPGALELEPFVRLLASPEGVSVPVDLLLEVPFHITPWFHPFIALGPTVAPVFRAEGTIVPFGGAAAIGAHFFVARDYALLVEANYNLLDNDGALLHEVGGTIGALVGF